MYEVMAYVFRNMNSRPFMICMHDAFDNTYLMMIHCIL